jgi:hypothetical protein
MNQVMSVANARAMSAVVIFVEHRRRVKGEGLMIARVGSRNSGEKIKPHLVRQNSGLYLHSWREENMPLADCR